MIAVSAPLSPFLVAGEALPLGLMLLPMETVSDYDTVTTPPLLLDSVHDGDTLRSLKQTLDTNQCAIVRMRHRVRIIQNGAHGKTQGNRSNAVSKGPCSRLSKQARAKLDMALDESSLHWSILLTLTYGEIFPTDGATLKRQHLRRFIARLERAGFRGVWVMAATERGLPHFHMALAGAMPTPETDTLLREHWQCSIGDYQGNTHTEPFRAHRDSDGRYTPDSHIGYMTNQPQREMLVTTPGQFWGKFGVPEPEIIADPIIGTRQEIAPLLRSVIGAENARRRKRGKPATRRNRGDNSFTIRDGATIFDTVSKNAYGLLTMRK